MHDGTQEDAARYPTYRHLEQTHQVLVQDDLLNHEIRPPQSLIEEYHTHAQMLAPVVCDNSLIGVISVHQVGSPRQWTPADVTALSATARPSHSSNTSTMPPPTNDTRRCSASRSTTASRRSRFTPTVSVGPPSVLRSCTSRHAARHPDRHQPCHLRRTTPRDRIGAGWPRLHKVTTRILGACTDPHRSGSLDTQTSPPRSQSRKGRDAPGHVISSASRLPRLSGQRD